MAGLRVWSVLVTLLLWLNASAAAAQTIVREPELGDTGLPVILKADQIIHDDELGTVVASGHVEIAQGERVLLADTVSYNQRSEVVTASGNVTLLEPSGDVLFADYVKLSDQMKEGVIRQLRIRMSDDSRMAANWALRTGGNRTEMSKAVYSPCQLCPLHPERPPLWQIKAAKVVHDQEARDIAYYDAWLEMFGVPVVYMPYFEHPDPTVQRRSGLLAPSYGSSSTLGIMLTTPYYFNIAPHRDATFSPMFTTKEGVVLGGEYREHTGNGQLELSGSLTRPDRRDDDGNLTGGKAFRGHVFGRGKFALDPIWRWGFDLERATDDTYLSRYRITSKDTLTIHPYVEGFNRRSYAAGNAYLFQGLKEDDDADATPVIAPLLDGNFISEPNSLGAYFSLDANFMALQRKEGPDSRRVSVEGGWHLPYISDAGEVYRLSLSLRGDLYHVNNVMRPDLPAGPTERGLTGRLRPELLLEWRYPLVARIGNIRYLFEPVVQGLASPYGGNPAEIPNEDSQDFEFDDSNLLSANRFTGLDRVEGGQRINYGVRLGFYGSSGGRTTALLGQSARLREDDTFNEGSGLEDNLSDYVGHVNVSPTEYFDLAYRFRIDHETFEARRNEIDAAMGPDFLRASVGYILLEDQISSGDTTVFANREELRASATARFASYWRLSASARRDLTGAGGTINAGGSLVYEDECFLFSSSLIRDFTRDRDVGPETNIMFSIKFKHLG